MCHAPGSTGWTCGSCPGVCALSYRGSFQMSATLWLDFLCLPRFFRLVHSKSLPSPEPIFDLPLSVPQSWASFRISRRTSSGLKTFTTATPTVRPCLGLALNVKFLTLSQCRPDLSLIGQNLSHMLPSLGAPSPASILWWLSFQMSAVFQ